MPDNPTPRALLRPPSGPADRGRPRGPHRLPPPRAQRPELAGDESTWTALALRGVLLPRHAFSPLQEPDPLLPARVSVFHRRDPRVLGGLTAVKWAQALAGALLVPAVGRAVSLASSARAGLLAAAGGGLLPELVWFSVHFWSETLFLVLLWWGFERVLAAHASGRTGAAVAGGVLWGLASFTRETALYFVPVAGLWLAFAARAGAARPGGGLRPPASSLRRSSWSRPGPIATGSSSTRSCPCPPSGPTASGKGTRGCPSTSSTARRTPSRSDRAVPAGPGARPVRHPGAPAPLALREDPRRAAGAVGPRDSRLRAAGSERLRSRGRHGEGPDRGVMVAPYLAVLVLAVPGLAALRVTPAGFSCCCSSSTTTPFTWSRTARTASVCR